jgi:tetratricopeptide (TPR) repeat protein
LRLRPFLVPAILVLLALLAFSNAFRAPFVYDDHALFVDPAITSPNGWYLSFHPSQTRPLTWFSFWLNYAVAGRNAATWHAVNLVLHLGACLLLLDALSRIVPREQAVVAAFVFALHPIQTEPVLYVFARGTLLAALLCLLSLRAWTRGGYWPAVAWFGFALLAKEECAAFPAFLLLLHFAGSRKSAERLPIVAMLALAAAAVIRVAVTAAMNPGSGAGVHAGVSPATYLTTQGVTILRYFQLMAIPVGFSVDPPVTPPAIWQALLAWGVILGAALLAWRRFKGPREGFWFLGGLILLLPTSSIFPAADLAADRRLYLPMIAFSAFAAMLLRRTTFPVLLAAGAITYAMLSFARADVWTSEAALWEDAMRQAPEKVRPRLQLARLQPPGQAIELLQETRKIAPDDASVAVDLGRIYLAQGNASRALGEFGRAVALAPENASAHSNRGVALLAVGLRDHAITDFRRALELNPCLFDAYLNLRRLSLPVSPASFCRYNPDQLAALQEGSQQ